MNTAAEDIDAKLLGPGGPFELEEADVFGERMAVFKSRVRSFRDLLVGARRFGDAEYFAFTDGNEWRRFTFAEHESLVASTARVLRDEYGVGRGDRVAILGANSPEWIVSFWATISLGAIAVGLNGWSTGPEILYAVGDSDPKLLVADARRLARLEGADPGVPVVEMESGFDALWHAYPEAELPDTEIHDDEPALILYTSGTTGRPKGAVHTHGNIGSLLAMTFFHGARGFMLRPPPADALPTCQLMTSPLFHVSGLHTGAIAFMATGTRSVWLTGKFDPLTAAKVIEQERCTGWSITETVLHRMVNHPEIHQCDISSLRQMGGGGSPVSPSLQRRARDAFPNAGASMGLGYGLTECTALATVCSGQELIDHPLSCGRPLPTVQLEIRDLETGEPVPEGAEGEVCIRSPGVMLGYWRNPEATAAAIGPRRWLKTGDIGHLDDGRLYLSSRRRDLILRGAENVYPVEVEKTIEDHPDVAECAVFGVDDAEYGQAVKAVVVPRPGRLLDVEALRAFTAKAISYYKVPTQWEVRTDPLPRNASGKLTKEPLRTGAAVAFVEEERMPLDLTELVASQHTALVLQEVQNGVVGTPSALPALSEAAAAVDLIGNCARLARAARAAGVPVFHCTAETRDDGKGANRNARLFAGIARLPVKISPGSDAVQVPAEIGVEHGDVVLPRHHGLGPMTGTQLDPMLRNLGVRTIVGVGVSVNIGITSLAFDAVNWGYQIVLPADAIAGVPPEYAAAVIENTLSLVATMTTTAAILDVWAEKT